MEQEQKQMSVSEIKTSTSSDSNIPRYWRTNFYPINSRGLEYSGPANEKVVHGEVSPQVQAPCSGLFGFVFGTKNHKETFESLQSDYKGPQKAFDDFGQHCGCTFKATFSVGNFGQDSHSEKSLLLPIVSPTSNQRVVTSTRIAKSIFLPKGTRIRSDCLSSCNGKHSTCEWLWGLVLQKNCDVENSEQFINPTKRARKTDDNGASICKADEIGNEMNQKHIQLECEQINFDPPETSKKPFLCTKCCRRFPNSQGVRNHYISAHAPKLGKERSESDDDDYADIVGPKLFRTRLDTAYEDNDVVIVVKPQGLPVQGSRWTLPKSDLLMQFKSKLKRKGDLSKPRITHRLDSATGGLLVVAKSADAEKGMKKHFENRMCKKRYRAIVFGKVIQNQHKYSDLGDDERSEDSYSGMGVINLSLGGKRSITRYRVVNYTECDHPLAKGFITTIDLFPVTGRKHQLRRHLQSIGHPIWGDNRYAPYSKIEIVSNMERDIKFRPSSMENNLHNKMCLWALEISFPHPCNDNIVHASIDEPLWYGKLRAEVSEISVKKIEIVLK